MESATESKTAIEWEIDSTMQTDVNSISARVSLETLSSDSTPDDLNSVCVKVETDEWNNVANVFYSTCTQSEQALQEEIHQDDNKQDGCNFSYDKTVQMRCVAKDQDLTKQDGLNLAFVKLEQTECTIMHQDDNMQAGFNSVCVNRKQTAVCNAYTEQKGPISVCDQTKQSVNPNADQICVTTNCLSTVREKLKQYVNTRMETGNTTYNNHNYVCGKRVCVALSNHLFIQTDDCQYKCKVSGYARQNKCKVCGYECNQSCTLKKHMKLHTGEKLYKCDVCGYASNRSSSLKIHMRIHTEEKRYKCEVCGYECRLSSHLKRHMGIHTEGKRYKCEVCGYACNARSNLKKHMGMHTKEKRYKCEVCGYAFNDRSNLKRHMGIHTRRKKRYKTKCEVCGYACNDSSRLKKHMGIHTGEIAFKCEVMQEAIVVT